MAQQNNSTNNSTHPVELRVYDGIRLGKSLKQIAQELGVKRYNINRSIASLREQGYIRRVGYGVWEILKPMQTTKHFESTPQGGVSNGLIFRLHNEQFRVKLWFKPQNYVCGRREVLLGNHVFFNKRVIQVYSNQDFYGGSVGECDAQAEAYWLGFFGRLEAVFGVRVLKVGWRFFERFNAHYSSVRDGVAVSCRRDGSRLVVLHPDGKLRFVVDLSLGEPEFEAVHAGSARGDMGEVWQPFVRDLVEKRPPVPSEIWALSSKNTEHIFELGSALRVLLGLLGSGGDEGSGEGEGRQDYFG